MILPEEDIERAADGDPEAIRRLEAVPQATVISDRRMAGLLAIALDEGAAALAASRVAAALAATSPSARRRSITRVRRRIRGRRERLPIVLAASAILTLLGLGLWWRFAHSPNPAANQTLADGSRIVPSLGAVWRATTTADGVGVRLDRGLIAVSAQPQAPGRQLTVSTADARIAVVGTEFTVAAHTSHTELAVAHGTVEITTTSRERLLVSSAGTATARSGAWPGLLPMHLAHDVSVVRAFVPVDGMPPKFWHARVGPCPPGRVGDALHAVDYSELFPVFGVAYDNYEDPADTIRMAAGMRFQAWIWCDGPLTDLKVQTCDGDRDMDFWLPLSVARRTWVRLDIPLVLLTDDAGRHPEAGNRIADLHVYAARAGGQTIVLDQARLVVPMPSTP